MSEMWTVKVLEITGRAFHPSANPPFHSYPCKRAVRSLQTMQQDFCLHPPTSELRLMQQTVIDVITDVITTVI